MTAKVKVFDHRQARPNRTSDAISAGNSCVLRRDRGRALPRRYGSADPTGWSRFDRVACKRTSAIFGRPTMSIDVGRCGIGLEVPWLYLVRWLRTVEV
jgi:hypothetical protein